MCIPETHYLILVPGTGYQFPVNLLTGCQIFYTVYMPATSKSCVLVLRCKYCFWYLFVIFDRGRDFREMSYLVMWEHHHHHHKINWPVRASARTCTRSRDSSPQYQCYTSYTISQTFYTGYQLPVNQLTNYHMHTINQTWYIYRVPVTSEPVNQLPHNLYQVQLPANQLTGK